MLSRRKLIVLVVLTFAAAFGGWTVAVPAPSLADPIPQPTGGGGCDEAANPDCRVEGGRPGGGGNGGGSGGSGGRCTWKGQTIPCQDPDFGFWVRDGCYWKVAEPPPPIPPPAIHKPGVPGAWGVESCLRDVGGGRAVSQVFMWMDNPPGGPTPAELAQQALAKIKLLGAQIGITPDPSGSGAAGLPVWLWTAVTPGTWGPLSASASGGGITVTITAKAQRIEWNMGDGQTKTCDNPGTPYEDRFGNSMSPTCGYRYGFPSATAANPNGRYTVTATTHWRVEWSGGGQSGVLNPTSQSQTSVRIGEIPVVGGG